MPDHGGDRFRMWVKQYGVSRLQRVLGKSSRTSIQEWIKANAAARHQPRPTVAVIIIGLSMKEPLKADGRPLSYEDIYGSPEATEINAAGGPAANHERQVREL